MKYITFLNDTYWENVHNRICFRYNIIIKNLLQYIFNWEYKYH